MKYNEKFLKRFCKDFDIPMPIYSETHYEYFLNLYQPYCGSRDKYDKVCKEIDEKFNGDPEKFLEYYYSFKDEVIEKTKNNPEFREFNNKDMNTYKVPKTNTPRNLHTRENAGKLLLSIDLRQGNFQALSHETNIFTEYKTYEDWIGQLTDSEYIRSSKYLRQRIFGELNPGRQMTVEAWLMNKVREYLLPTLGEPMYRNADELVYDITDKGCSEYEDGIFKELGIRIHSSVYRIIPFEIWNADANKKIQECFIKVFLNDRNGVFKFVGVPLYFHAIAYRWLKQMRKDTISSLFMMNDVISCFKDDIECKLANKEDWKYLEGI